MQRPRPMGLSTGWSAAVGAWLDGRTPDSAVDDPDSAAIGYRRSPGFGSWPRTRRRSLVCPHCGGARRLLAAIHDRIVPRVAEDGEQEGLDKDCEDPEEAQSDEVAAGSEAPPVARVPHRPGKWRRAVRRYYTWAELLRRVFRVDVFTCPNCGGVRRLLLAIKDPDSIERVLRATGLPWEAPELVVARTPPDGGGGWLGA